MWPFKSASPVPQLTLKNPDDVSRELHRYNSIISDQMGIGLPNFDPLENISVTDAPIYGGLARQYYRGLDIVQRIVDSPAKDALRPEYKIITKYDEYGIGELIHERFDELKFHEKALKWLIYSRLYSRGALMMPICRETIMRPDRLHYRQPLVFDYLEKIETLNVVREDLFYYLVQSYDPFATDFEDFQFISILGSDVHRSRLYLYVPSLDPIRQRGTSVLERILTGCVGLNVTQWSISQMLLKYRALILKFPSKEIHNIEGGAKDGQKKRLAELLDTIKMQFTSKSVLSIPDNYDAQYLQTSFEGLKAATDFQFEYLSTVTDLPQSLIKGSAEGDIASARENKRNYYEVVDSGERKGKLEPLMRWLAKFICNERDGKIYDLCCRYGIDPNRIKINIEFEQMASVDPLTEAQVDFTKMQTSALEIERGVLNPQEVRSDRHPELSDYASGEVDEESPSMAWDSHKPLEIDNRGIENLRLALQRLGKN